MEEGSHPKAESALPACRQGHAGDTPAQLNVLGLVANSGSSDATGTPASSSLGYNTPTLNTAAEELSAHHRLSNSHLAQSGSGLPELVSPGAAAAALPAGEPSASRKRPRSLSTAAASVPRARPRARQGAAPPVLPSMLPAEPHAEEEALLALAQQSERAASLSASTVKEAVRGLRRALKIGDGAADGATESGTNGQETSMPASGHVEMRAHDGAFASWYVHCARHAWAELGLRPFLHQCISQFCPCGFFLPQTPPACCAARCFRSPQRQQRPMRSGLACSHLAKP